MSFGATVTMVGSLVMVLFFSCNKSIPSGSEGVLDPLDTYLVTYNGNGNTSGTVPAFQRRTPGTVAIIFDNSGNLVKKGYIFDGWNTVADGSGINYKAGSRYTAGDNITMYAKWRSNEIVAGPTVTDADGNVYTSIIIGKQIWTVENLKTTKYNDGTAIPNVTNSSQWLNLTTGAYCYYDNNIANKTKYGALYNWYAVNTGKLAPEGWRVPTNEEWDTLQSFLIANGYNWDGSNTGNKIAKSVAAQTDWISDKNAGSIGNDLSRNNASGFSALPGGRRNDNGLFIHKRSGGFWWSVSEIEIPDHVYAWFRYFHHFSEILARFNGTKGYGYSVRLIRDY